MYDFSLNVFSIMTWITAFFYCILMPVFALIDKEKLIYPLLASAFTAVIGFVFVIINIISASWIV